MSSGKQESPAPYLGRRELLSYSAAFGAAFMARQGLAAPDDVPAKAEQSRYWRWAVCKPVTGAEFLPITCSISSNHYGLSGWNPKLE